MGGADSPASPSDARVIFHAVLLNILPMVTRRLGSEERSLITPGSVYVWEERGPNTELTGVGIERWTDGIRWGPSRVREGFLFYHEKQDHHYPYSDSSFDPYASGRDTSRVILIKQTYTVYVETPRGTRKWHLIAYFTEESLDFLQTIDDLPHLATLAVPHSKYKSARSTKGRPENIFNPEQEGQEFSRIEYVLYRPKSPVSDRSSHSPPEHNTDSATLRKWISHGTAGRVVPSTEPPYPPNPSAPPSPEENLAPLVYLQAVSPPRRYPEDEKTLKLLATKPIM
ncbi:hypothetical protein K435DRAFT_868167 [Dendrothele bispora CBS 962.96]|uniref:cAMP-independent regulatory protein pac2 n=1 Tax=Dendrothele bispora (strain CBS 962.96) TaxID=1314807 RepID=A0A4S8LCH0_DENBC|nr:hypothetical protein K435DRAFT_868167 [Dendrothele bispora CBS 962.96]